MMSDEQNRPVPSFDVMEAVFRLSDLYATFDQDAACARGWCLNQYGDGMIGIVRDDDMDTFAGANDARQHVAVSAVAANDLVYRDLCAKALVIEAASMAIRDATSDDED